MFFVITTTTTVLRPFVRDYPGESVPEETLTHPPFWIILNFNSGTSVDENIRNLVTAVYFKLS